MCLKKNKQSKARKQATRRYGTNCAGLIKICKNLEAMNRRVCSSKHKLNTLYTHLNSLPKICIIMTYLHEIADVVSLNVIFAMTY